ncbi:MAG TPA: hypothetical protein DHU26_05720, partial [Spirochaetaceae bacterium]|nr:hypothetical protein [Spirochaetaceae bacterium]
KLKLPRKIKLEWPEKSSEFPIQIIGVFLRNLCIIICIDLPLFSFLAGRFFLLPAGSVIAPIEAELD